MIRLSPAKMAEIYYNRIQGRSIFAVSQMIKDYQPGSDSWLYWREVLSLLGEIYDSKRKVRAP